MPRATPSTRPVRAQVWRPTTVDRLTAVPSCRRGRSGRGGRRSAPFRARQRCRSWGPAGDVHVEPTPPPGPRAGAVRLQSRGGRLTAEEGRSGSVSAASRRSARHARAGPRGRSRALERRRTRARLERRQVDLKAWDGFAPLTEHRPDLWSHGHTLDDGRGADPAGRARGELSHCRLVRRRGLHFVTGRLNIDASPRPRRDYACGWTLTPRRVEEALGPQHHGEAPLQLVAVAAWTELAAAVPARARPAVVARQRSPKAKRRRHGVPPSWTRGRPASAVDYLCPPRAAASPAVAISCRWGEAVLASPIAWAGLSGARWCKGCG